MRVNELKQNARHYIDGRWETGGTTGISENPSDTREAVAEYARQFRKPSVIEATCEDYRAGASVDLAHDSADRESGRRLTCPLLVLWGRRYLAEQAASPLDIWRLWAADVREVALECGHFLAEEQPDACAAAMLEFFGG